MAIVTRGARGIGRACAIALAENGFDVALVDLLIPETQRTAGEIRQTGCRAVVPVMQRQGGSQIANMSSLNAYIGGVTTAVSKFAYGAAKAGILGLTRRICLDRLGTPRDVANVVVFLATTEPFFVTGQNLVIDGFQWIA